MNRGLYQHSSFDDVYKHRLKPWDNIFNDMKGNGYKESKPKRDNIEVAMNDSGQVLVINRRHRLAFAQTLQLETVPVVVNIISEGMAKAFAASSPHLAKQLKIDNISHRLRIASQQAMPHQSRKRQDPAKRLT